MIREHIASFVAVIDKSDEIILLRIIPNTRYVIIEPLWSKGYLKIVSHRRIHHKANRSKEPKIIAFHLYTLAKTFHK
ncbi:MAG TPA: hypothetical protein VI278_11055 [Nitrososphaeraceae archaeon]|jgi:hypothetical protein